MLLKAYTLETMLPECDNTTNTINAVADLADEVGESLPYLAAVVGVCMYDDRTKVLMFNHRGHRVVVCPRRITITKLKDPAEAAQVAGELKDLINNTYENRGSIAPCYNKGGEVRMLDVLRLLPGTNCRRCGQPTCTAFAAKMARQEAGVTLCSPLFGGEFEEKKARLLGLLQAAGYETSA